MTAPEVPVPDETDWTWVVEEPCDECGFDPSFDVTTIFTVRTFSACFLHDVEHHLHDVAA